MNGKNLLHVGCVALVSLAFQETLWASGLELTGTYTVPSGSYMDAPVELPAPEIQWDLSDDGTIFLEYDLPYEIVGEKAPSIKLHSISAQEPLHLRGENAEGICRNSEGRMACTITYQKNQEGVFPIDTDAGLAYMKGLDLDAVQIETIMKAQQTLMHEAVGILNFNLP
jgi:hypothetical protein